ncbi:MAG: phytoene/squalene synthase family protein, partial [Corynebacterium sp.]|nr:phytoene/squalene synthase family protein [Corynebacterium sp.]
MQATMFSQSLLQRYDNAAFKAAASIMRTYSTSFSAATQLLRPV